MTDTMTHELVRAERRDLAARPEDRAWLSTVELQLRVTKVKEIMASLMQVNVHYGIVSGCKKPSLWQPGAEILGLGFRLAPRFHNEISWRGNVFEIVCTCELYEIGTGQTVGEASRICSTDEKKYAWRRPICDQEFAATAPENKQITWEKDDHGKFMELRQVRTNPGDLQNTIIGMCEKRAYVGAIRRATAASEVFTDSIELLSPEIRQMFLEEDEDQDAVKAVSASLARRQNPGTPQQRSTPSASAPAPTTAAHYPAAGNTIIPFGKHKGSRMSEVPEDYVAWLAEKSTSPEIKTAAERYLQSTAAPPAEEPEQEILPPVAAGYEIPDITDPFADQ